MKEKTCFALCRWRYLRCSRRCRWCWRLVIEVMHAHSHNQDTEIMRDEHYTCNLTSIGSWANFRSGTGQDSKLLAMLMTLFRSESNIVLVRAKEDARKSLRWEKRTKDSTGQRDMLTCFIAMKSGNHPNRSRFPVFPLLAWEEPTWCNQAWKVFGYSRDRCIGSLGCCLSLKDRGWENYNDAQLLDCHTIDVMNAAGPKFPAPMYNCYMYLYRASSTPFTNESVGQRAD